MKRRIDIDAAVTEDYLKELYYEKKWSTVDIAKHLGCSRVVVTRLMDQYQVSRRTPRLAGIAKSRRYTYKEGFFRSIDTADKAYLMGFFLGDGHIAVNGHSLRLVVGLANEDASHLVNMAAYIGDASMVKIQDAKAPNEQDKAVLTINSTELCRDLMKHGFPVGSKSGMEPFINFDDALLTWAFVRGAFDADGYIGTFERSCSVKGKVYGPYRKAKWTMTIGLPFIQGLCDFFSSQGIELAPLAIQPKQGTAVVECSKIGTIRNIATHMYSSGQLYLPRKKAVFNSL